MDILDNSSEYFNSPEGGFYPISKTDCKIIDIISQIASLSNLPDEVKKILDSYKRKIPDEKVLEKLLDWKDRIADEKLEGKKSQEVVLFPKQIIIIGNMHIDISIIETINKYSCYDTNTKGMKYQILINEFSENTKKPIIFIPFLNEDYRDKEYKTISEKLQKCKTVTIL